MLIERNQNTQNNKTMKNTTIEPKVKICAVWMICESLGMNPVNSYFTGVVKIKFPDRQTITRRGRLPFAETIQHGGKEYTIRYVDYLQKLPKLQAAL